MSTPDPRTGVVATAGDPYLAMLRSGAVPALVVALVCTIVFAVVDGSQGLAGALTAAAVVVVTFASSMIVLRRTARLGPLVVFMVAMVGFTTKVLLLGLFLVLFRDATWMSPLAFALTAIASSLAWTTGEVVAFMRVRTAIFDVPGPDAATGVAP